MTFLFSNAKLPPAFLTEQLINVVNTVLSLFSRPFKKLPPLDWQHSAMQKSLQILLTVVDNYFLAIVVIQVNTFTFITYARKKASKVIYLFFQWTTLCHGGA